MLDSRGDVSLETIGAKIKYITISLGIEYESHHYKLVAGIIPEHF